MMFVETIRIENGRLQLPELHQQRMAATIREVYLTLLCFLTVWMLRGVQVC